MYSEGVFQFYFMNMPQPVILIQQEKHQLYYKECNKAAQQFFDKMEDKIINKEENLLFTHFVKSHCHERTDSISIHTAFSARPACI